MTEYREVILKIHCLLRMHECRFEFDTGYGNDLRINFSNEGFVNGNYGGGEGGMLVLAGL